MTEGLPNCADLLPDFEAKEAVISLPGPIQCAQELEQSR